MAVTNDDLVSFTHARRPRIKKAHHKVRSGCVTCKSRRIKCDEEKPKCSQCVKSNRQCYFRPVSTWMFELDSEGRRTGAEIEVSPNDSIVSIAQKGSVDPFDALPVSINQQSHALIQFYLAHTSNCPWVWETRPPKTLDGDSPNTYRTTVAQSLQSPLRFSTFLSLTSVLMKIFGSSDLGTTLGPMYVQQALKEIKDEITSGTKNQEELLYGVSRMSLAAVLDEDDVGARAHLKAARHLLDNAPWSHIYDSSITACLSYGDMHLAVASISAPMLAQPPSTGVTNPTKAHIPTEMPEDATEVLEQSRIYFFDTISEAYATIVRCFLVYKSISLRQSDISVQWVGFEASALLGKLLHACYVPSSTYCSRGEWESAKVSLVLWMQILALCMNEINLPHLAVRSHTTTFSKQKIDTMTGIWPACVRDGLSMWNSTLASDVGRSPSSFSPAFECLLSAAELTESLSPVHVADFVRGLVAHLVTQNSESDSEQSNSALLTPPSSCLGLKGHSRVLETVPTSVVGKTNTGSSHGEYSYSSDST